jgi:hypothetical protein
VECPGGIGVICGEINPLTVVGSSPAYARICACICPIEKCTPLPSNSTTTTTRPMIEITNKFIVLFKNPYGKLLKFKEILVGSQLLLYFCLSLTLFFVELIILSLYYFAFSQFIDLELGQLFLLIRFTVEDLLGTNI